MVEVKVIAGPKSWIEGDAVRQLEKTAELPGMVRAIGMPGLHPGQGCPVDAIFITEDRIYPHLIGTDIGCGMGLWRTTIRKQQPERIAKKLRGLEGGVEDADKLVAEFGLKPTGFEHSLGTIGRGNHFAEFLLVDEIRDPEAVEILGDASVFLLVHSGSRGFGEKILFDHTATHQGKGIGVNEDESETWNAYWQSHNHAVDWAGLNRRVIADRMLDALGSHGELLLESVHNFLDATAFYAPMETKIRYIHRKGAIPTQAGYPVVIPGSRGAHSYLVMPIGDHPEAGWSVSHGAGRKMSRTDAFEKSKRGARRSSRAVSFKDLERTKFGSIVICEDKRLLMEENPEAYKPIDRVIQDLVDHELVRVLALFKPLVTYKTTRPEIEH